PYGQYLRIGAEMLGDRDLRWLNLDSYKGPGRVTHGTEYFSACLGSDEACPSDVLADGDWRTGWAGDADDKPNQVRVLELVNRREETSFFSPVFIVNTSDQNDKMAVITLTPVGCTWLMNETCSLFTRRRCPRHFR